LVKIGFPPNQSNTINMALTGFNTIIDDYFYFYCEKALYRINLNSISTSSIESLTAGENKLILFPNPLENETLNIKTSENWNGSTDLLLYDVKSSCVLNARIHFTNGNGKISIHDLPKGMYFLTIKKDGKSQSGRFVIQ